MKIIDHLKQEWVEPIKGVKELQYIPFSEFIKKFKSNNFEEIYKTQEYKDLEEKGFVLGFLEEREYSGMNWGLHMGMDVWVKAGVPVYSVGDGRVVFLHRYSNETNNNANVNYDHHPDAWGNFIMMEHEYEIEDKKVKVYVSYAHMKKIPEHIQIGSVLKKGEKISETGESFTLENGGWPSHLHIQIALDRSLLAHGYTLDRHIEDQGLINPEKIFL
jgi:murein DD-endopeptidase MepM/ murein hydrolase activator NlpD